MTVHPDRDEAEHITIETGKPAEMPHILATNRYGTYCIPDDFKKRQVPQLLRTGKVKGIRFETLARICTALECQPGDILEAVEGVGKNSVDSASAP